MAACENLTGSPSLLDAHTFSEAIDRLNPKEWSVLLSSNCQSGSVSQVYKLIPFVFTVSVYAVYIVLCCIIAKLFGPRKMTPPQFMRLFSYTMRTMVVFVASLALIRLVPSTFLIIVHFSSCTILHILFAAVVMSGMIPDQDVPLGKGIHISLGSLFITLTIGDILLMPRENLHSYFSFMSSIEAKSTGETLLWASSVFLITLWSMTVTYLRIITTDTFLVVGKGHMKQKYVKKMDEWVLVGTIPTTPMNHV